MERNPVPDVTGDGMPIPRCRIFTLLSLSSASAIFWLPVPNSCTWGSWTIMLALILLLVDEQRRLGATAYVVASAFTPQHYGHQLDERSLGHRGTVALKQAIQLSVNALCLVVLLWGAQKFIFPSAQFFIEVGQSQLGQPSTIRTDAAQSRFVCLHTLVALTVRLMDDDGYIQYRRFFRLSQRLAFQFSTPGSRKSAWSRSRRIMVSPIADRPLECPDRQAALALPSRAGHHAAVRTGLAHGLWRRNVYHSMNFPLLIALTAFGTLGRQRALGLGAGRHPHLVRRAQQLQAVSSVGRVGQCTSRHSARPCLIRCRRIPDDHGPGRSGTFHWLFRVLSSAEHAYHEPGGDFSPQTPSFGVSFWLCDAQGRPLVTSQTMPLADIQQSFGPSAYPAVPMITTKTPYYDASWSRLDATHWELLVEAP